MADIKISQLGEALAVTDNDVLPMTASGVTSKVKTSTMKEYMIGDDDISLIGDGSATGAISTLNSGKAPKSDLASISITGSTNNTGNTIASGTYFYKDGALVKAISSIANGATLTSGTNYSTVTAGALNEINDTTMELFGNTPAKVTYAHGYYLFSSSLTGALDICQALLTDVPVKTGNYTNIDVLVQTNVVWKITGYVNESKTVASLLCMRYDGTLKYFYRNGSDTVKDVTLA